MNIWSELGGDFIVIMGRTKLSVVLVIVCVVKCLAMTYDELEDFAEHLKKTSQLSPTLKSKWSPR